MPSLFALLREDLSHRTWMIALSLLGSFLACPVAFLFCNKGLDRTPSYLPPDFFGLESEGVDIAQSMASYYLADMYGYLPSTHLGAQLVVLCAGALILAWFGFRHLYSRRMVDLYHSAPVSRDRLFLANWLSGFFIWFVPFLLGNLCIYAMMLYKIGMPVYWGEATLLWLKVMLLCILCFLIVYNACLVPVMVSGNLMNALVNILTYGLAAAIGYFTFLGCMESYFDTYISWRGFFPSPLVPALSPLAAPLYLSIYFYIAVSRNAFSSDWIVTLALTALVTAGNFLLARLLHRKRSSELAERGLENRWFRVPLRFVISYLSGLLLALFFEAVSHREAWVLFGAVFGSVLAFSLTNIIYHAGFKFFLNHKAQLLFCLLATCGTVGIFRYDLFGYDRYLPKESEITGLSLYSDVLSDESYKNMSAYKVRHSKMPPEDVLCTDSAVIRRLLETLVESGGKNNVPDRSLSLTETEVRESALNVRVDTIHGSYYRSYKLFGTREQLEALRPILETDSCRERFYPASREDWKLPDQMLLNPWNDIRISLRDSSRIQELHEAYRQDFLEHYCVLDVPPTRGTPYIDYCYTSEGGGTSHINLYFPEAYQRTLTLLKKWYPEQIWSLKDLEIKELQICVYTKKDSRSALYGELGLPEPSDKTKDKTGTDIPGAETLPNQTDHAFYSYCFWEKSVTAPEELARWEPYLILDKESSFFDDAEYVKLGAAVLSGNDNEELNAACYVKKRSLPSALLDELEPRH